MGHGYPPFRIEIIKVSGGYRYRFWDADNLPHDFSAVFETEAECLSAADRQRAALGATYAGADDPPLRIEIIRVDGGYRYRLWDADHLTAVPSRVFETDDECRREARQRRATMGATATDTGVDD
jgi:hypothetical protein